MGGRLRRLKRRVARGETPAEESSRSSDEDREADLRSDGGEPASSTRWLGLFSGSVDDELLQSLPFWLPAALLVGLFVYGAIGWNFLISLTDWSGLGQPDYSTLSFETYRLMLSDPNFIAATRNTFVLLLVFTGVSLVLGLGMAILIDQGIRFENTFRTIYLLPMSLSFVVTAIFWSWMYNASSGGINVTLRAIGLDFLAMNWLGDPRVKLASIIFALMWQFSGYCMIVYLAGLRAIPNEHYEAAKVDGASSLRMYRRVIVPQLRAATMGAAVVLMVFALKAFDFIFVMFGTNPGRSADILAVMMFREAFSATNWAYGSAIAVVLFLMALGVIAPYAYVQYQRGEL